MTALSHRVAIMVTAAAAIMTVSYVLLMLGSGDSHSDPVFSQGVLTLLRATPLLVVAACAWAVAQREPVLSAAVNGTLLGILGTALVFWLGSDDFGFLGSVFVAALLGVCTMLMLVLAIGVGGGIGLVVRWVADW